MRLGRTALALISTTAATVLIFGQAVQIAFADSEHAGGNGNGRALGHEDAPGLADEALTNASTQTEGQAAVDAAAQINAPADQECDGDPSGHSDTGNGANQGGYYDHKCDGDSSHNGNGGGNATGRPCEGCVGNADDKNPGQGSNKGQMPDESDGNKGYECDGNKGIGKGNPAHTGCQDHTPTTPPSTPPSTPPTTPPSTPPSTVSSDTQTQVLGVKVVASDNPQVQGGALPRTGVDATSYLWAALLLMVAGVVLVDTANRRERIERLTAVKTNRGDLLP